MPKNGFFFSKFERTDVRIWVDKCHTFFAMYKIPDKFKVVATTMYLTGRATHWYHAYKMSNVWLDWEQFREAVVSEFEGNTQRDRMSGLLLPK